METVFIVTMVAVLIILIGVMSIDGKLWKIWAEQRRHHQAVEEILEKIRDGGRAGGPVNPIDR